MKKMCKKKLSIFLIFFTAKALDWNYNNMGAFVSHDSTGQTCRKLKFVFVKTMKNNRHFTLRLTSCTALSTNDLTAITMHRLITWVWSNEYLLLIINKQQLTLVGKFMSAPLSNMSLTYSGWPYLAAVINAVQSSYSKEYVWHVREAIRK